MLQHFINDIAPVTVEEITRVLLGFKPASSGAPGRLTPQHLKDLIADDKNIGTRKLCEALAALVILLLKRKVRAKIVKVLYGTNLTAFGKKVEGFRPIDVGTTFRRSAAKVICKTIRRLMESFATSLAWYWHESRL